MPLYLTFDIGTSSLKTALIDGAGGVLAIHTHEYSPVLQTEERVEMRPDAYWEAAVIGTRAVLSRSERSGEDVAAIGFCSQGQTFIPIDADGNPLYNAIVWIDNRAQYIADAWTETWLSRKAYRRISGYPWVPALMTPFKIAWLKEHEPSAHRAWKFLWPPDYLIYRMSGEVVTDRVTAQMSGMYDLPSSGWAPRLLDAAGIESSQLPALVESGTVAGLLREGAAAELGLRAGIPVCAGTNDQSAGMIGAGNVCPGIITETTGTALAVLATTSELLDDERFVVGRHAVAGRYYALSMANSSAIVLKWFRDIFSPGENYDTFLAGVESISPGCDGLTVLPHFCGTATPTFNSDAKGAFVGLTLGHTRAHMARAIMESCACLLKECMQPIIDHDLAPTCVRSLGGAAHSDVWLQMKADLLGIPVERPSSPDASSSLGAAMLAAVGTGQFADVEEAAEAWCRASTRFTPDAGRYKVYQEVYGRYLAAYDSLYGER